MFNPNSIIPIPKNATNTVYVEGIPVDASEREVAHIFRPFIGFRTVRLIRREKRPGEKVVFCFVDFETPLQTTIVINTL
jgi:RNA recognition motif-containing protein